MVALVSIATQALGDPPGEPPGPPQLVGPSDGAVAQTRSPLLEVQVQDPDVDPLEVTFHGRVLPPPAFTLVMIPDTQYYVSSLNGGTPAMFHAQTEWIVSQIASRNIVYVGHLGDCVENGDNGGNPIEWQHANAAISKLEDPVTTGFAQGMPYGISVGNHDQTPDGSADGTTNFYNQYFGSARFAGRDYYGGHYGSNNDNWYELFEAGGMQFIVISFEFDTAPDAAVLAWADQLLTQYENRRAIVISHWLVNVGQPAVWSAQGLATYEALKAHDNLFLMVAGHRNGEAVRTDSFAGNTVHTLLSDYQGRTNGGNGWLRILEFSHQEDVIRVRTYSPWLGQFETDADSSSQFTLPYDMPAPPPFTAIGSVGGVPSGGLAAVTWPDLAPETTFEWYAAVNDGHYNVNGPTWTLTTPEGVAPVAQLTSPNGGEEWIGGQLVQVTWTATDNVGVAAIDVLLSRSGPGGPFETLAEGIANSGAFEWLVDGAPSADAFIRVVARDSAANQGDDLSDAAFAIVAPAGVGDAGPARGLALGAWPNPAHGAVDLSFDVQARGPLRLEVFDVQGRLVATLASGVHEPGRYATRWSGAGPDGRAKAGIYLVRLSAGARTLTRHLLLIR